MKISNIRMGFATNSSSSHSIILLKGNKKFDLPKKIESEGDYAFGWDWFVLTDNESKHKYVLVQFIQNFVQENSNKNGDFNNFDLLEEVVFDIFGVKVEQQLINELKDSTYNVYVDHQSKINIRSDQVDFWKFFWSYVEKDNLVIIGGNDNSASSNEDVIRTPFSECEWFSKFTDSVRFISFKQEGDNVVLFNKQNGSKVRLSLNDSTYEKSITPELVDCKITDWCNKGCSFCYMSSTTAGKHAKKEDIFEIFDNLKKMNVFEVAIGGGEPTSHPDFVEILEYATKCNLVPNFTTYTTRWLKDEGILNAVCENVGGIGVSVHKLSDLKKIDHIRESFKSIKTSTHKKPSIMAQHVVGSVPMTVTSSIILSCLENYKPILLLGYKNVGFGEKVESHDVTDLPVILKLMLEKKYWASVSVDTALLNQIPDLLETLNVDEVFATKEEGKFSCYIDAVEKTLASSSYCKSAIHKLPNDVESIVNIYKTF